MIRSMTGYGQASAELPEAKVTVELRTLNHRYADLRMRLPAELVPQENAIRRKVLDRVKRGRVELAINFVSPAGGETRPQFNRELFEEVVAASEQIKEESRVDGKLDFAALLGVPGMFKSTAAELEWGAAQQAALDEALDGALSALESERRREGRHLCEELLGRLAAMAGIAAEIRERAGELPGTVRDRLIERLQSLSPDVELEPARLAQEAAILADRCDVTEELVRLEGHLDQTRSLLDQPDGEPVGKRMDFLLQEINRETNTINSKSADLELSRKALALRAEIEKVREQIQNLE